MTFSPEIFETFSFPDDAYYGFVLMVSDKYSLVVVLQQLFIFEIRTKNGFASFDFVLAGRT